MPTKIIRKYFFLIAFTSPLFINTDCKKDPVTPVDVKPGRRDYVWTVDTLQIPPNDIFYPWRMWGSSANDVWLAGEGSPTTLWHFDGNYWKRMTAYDGKTAPTALWGFASNNIWLGSINEFWRYNGTGWYKYSDITPPSGFQYTLIEDIWGNNPFDVWGVGFTDQPMGTEYKGIIMRFDGVQWRYVTIPDLRVSFVKIRQQSFTHLLFLEGRYATNHDTFKVYLYDEKKELKEIYSSLDQMNIEAIGSEVYFVIRHKQKIYKYIDDKLTLWKDFSGTTYQGGMIGRSEMDFFGFREGNGILHYNGTDMQLAFDTNLSAWTWFIFEQNVFFAFKDLQNDISFVVHGHLP